MCRAGEERKGAIATRPRLLCERRRVRSSALRPTRYKDEEWANLRCPGAPEFVGKRLAGLFRSLGAKPYLDGAARGPQRFSQGTRAREPNRPSCSSFGPAVKYTVSVLPPFAPLPTRRDHNPSMTIACPWESRILSMNSPVV